MLDWLHNRRKPQAEWMDRPDVDPFELRNSLRFIRRINRFLGYTRSIVGHFDRLSRTWRRGERIDVIDIGTGSADIPLALLGWAGRRGIDLRIVAVDLHPVTVRAAAGAAGHPRLRVVQADAFELPFEPLSFDYALSAMFLHHLDGAEMVRLLKVMDGLARRGLVLADLLRHRRAYAWIRLLTLGCSPMIRHDAAASVAQALTRAEVLNLRSAAGVDYLRYHRHFGHRFVLAGQRTGVPSARVAAVLPVETEIGSTS